MAKNDEVAVRASPLAALTPEWAMLEALMGGTATMRRAGEALLPRGTNEDLEDYSGRLKRATLFPAYRRTVRVMSGKPFAKSLQVVEAAPEVEAWCEDIDREGADLHAFASEMFAEVMAFGLAGILVDAPPPVEAVGAVVSKADQARAGVRPYFVRVTHDQIVGYRFSSGPGPRRLTQLRLAEAVQEPDGEFGECTVQQIRVLEPGVWRLFRADAKGNWLEYASGFTSLNYIPFVPLYGDRTGYMTARPPLVDLAYLNVEHWQSSSDQRTILHVARVPILALIGANDKTVLTVGAKSAVIVPSGGDIKWVEHTGAAIGAGQRSLEALEAQMIQSGAELLVKRPGARTATETATDAEGNKSDLQRMVETFEDALEQAMLMLADLGGIDRAGAGEIEMFKDFGVADLSGASAMLVKDLALAGVISNATAINELKRRGELSDKVEPEAEAIAIAEQGDPLALMAAPVEEEPLGQDDPLAAAGA